MALLIVHPEIGYQNLLYLASNQSETHLRTFFGALLLFLLLLQLLLRATLLILCWLACARALALCNDAGHDGAYLRSIMSLPASVSFLRKLIEGFAPGSLENTARKIRRFRAIVHERTI